ncbi:hypothetical protein BpHYR1_000392 [Brachionus plicatilis]|uniref:Uncharacterized protein n=1 Tax=Brachionus plicatilis TaxID=10195 RepID=A0A3M7Q629_BRAPC|nr:hypothetical protein BpHYR1_000392 [Brachionus plicatilis]
MSRREAALKARKELEKYKNCNNENSVFKSLYLDEAIESVIQNLNDSDLIDPNLDKTSKSNVIWTRLKDGEETSVRKKISFDQKPGPTSYAARQIDNKKLSAFFMIFDLTIVNLILNNTNKNAQKHEPDPKFSREDILAFIGVLFCVNFFVQIPQSFKCGTQNTVYVSKVNLCPGTSFIKLKNINVLTITIHVKSEELP